MEVDSSGRATQGQSMSLPAAEIAERRLPVWPLRLRELGLRLRAASGTAEREPVLEEFWPLLCVALQHCAAWRLFRTGIARH